MPRKVNAPWVVLGGKPGEVAFCERCGKGLNLVMPIEIGIFVAASKAFEKIHRKCQPGKYHEKPTTTLSEWLAGRDTGTSSKTLYAASTGVRMDHYDIPYDPSDFGRCYRLVKAFPQVRDGFRNLKHLCPKWVPFAEHWDELAALYEEELPAGELPKLYKHLQKLRRT